MQDGALDERWLQEGRDCILTVRAGACEGEDVHNGIAVCDDGVAEDGQQVQVCDAGAQDVVLNQGY